MKRALVICSLAMLIFAASSRTLAKEFPGEKGKWVRVRTENFTLLSNAGAHRARQIGKKLEQLREVLEETSTGMKFNEPIPTKIYVFKNESSFEPYKIGEDGRPGSLVGYFLRSIDGNFMAIDASAERVPYGILYHEYLHSFVENNVPGIPLWLNEGLAEFYSSFQIFGGKAEVGRPIPGHLQWLASHPLISLERLFSVDTDSEYYNEEGRKNTFYAQSWALTHFLLVDPAKRERMGRLLASLSQGTSSADAFETVYGTDPATIGNELAAYAKASAKRFYRITPEEAYELHTGESEQLERKEVLYHLGDLLVHHPPIQFEDAERHLQAALALDPAFARAFVALAALRLAADRFDEAAAFCRKAIELEPSNVRARTLYGTSLLRGFSASLDPQAAWPETTPAPLLQAREEFRKTIELSADDVDGRIGLGLTYLFEPGDVSEGIDALAQAVRSRPSRTDVLHHLIVLSARSGNLAGAKSLLERALRPRGDAELTRNAEAAVANIELEEARALFEAGKTAEARQRVGAIADGVQNPELKRELLEQLVMQEPTTSAGADEELREAALEAAEAGDAERTEAVLEEIARSAASRERAIELYNEAIEAANEGKLEEAATRLGQVMEMAEEAELREAAEAVAKEIRGVIEQNRLVDRYNEAVALLGEGELGAAADILRELVEADGPPEMREQVLRLLDEIAKLSGR